MTTEARIANQDRRRVGYWIILCIAAATCIVFLAYVALHVYAGYVCAHDPHCDL
jgi:hypothetical protein